MYTAYNNDSIHDGDNNDINVDKNCNRVVC